ncbi:MAG TPA: 50S ribosomal protein L11 methyltransferase [Candidatus Binataceae bacterium]|nr:50S ribosomal protein L11 methyltransferase [Candidatus Binataceae bacterium]
MIAQAQRQRRLDKARIYGRLAFDLPAARADEAGAVIVALGALGCEVGKLPRTVGAPLRSPRMARLTAYFAEANSARLRQMIRTIEASLTLGELRHLTIDRIEDPGWATMWMTRFEPFTIGKRLLIAPPWSQQNGGDRLRIVIQPGQGFGTGHHGSTYGVMRLLEELYRGHHYARVLDVGTGSGILAIAMKLLGACDITAIDNDPVALDNARENAELNGVARDLRISAIPLNSIRRRFDLITANILAPILIAMAPRLKRNLGKSGRLILAGILAREADTVTTAYQPELRCIGRRTDRGWTALLMAR